MRGAILYEYGKRAWKVVYTIGGMVLVVAGAQAFLLLLYVVFGLITGHPWDE